MAIECHHIECANHPQDEPLCGLPWNAECTNITHACLPVVILDIDNTIAHDAWRIRLIEHDNPDHVARYHAYHVASALDCAGNQQLFADPGVLYAIFTSRPARYRDITAAWLRMRGVGFRWLMMRGDGDLRGSVEVKRDFLYRLRSVHGVEFERIMCAYDDRRDVIAMYGEMGVVATHIQLAEVNYGS